MEDEIENITTQLLVITSAVSVLQVKLKELEKVIEYEPTHTMECLYPLLGMTTPVVEDFLCGLNTYLVGKKCVDKDFVVTPDEPLQFLFGKESLTYLAMLKIVFEFQE